MSRLLSTKDINFIKTLLENEPKKIEKIKIKDTSKDPRILDIISLSKKNNVEIIFEGIERIEAFFYPREMEDINFLEKNILLKQAPLIVILDHIQDPQNFGSILRAFWFSFVSVTTIGYGDITPMTSLGKTVSGISVDFTLLN